jgi:hypothetical protein
LAKATAATSVGRVTKPRLMWCAAPFGVPDDGHGSGDEQPPQILVALLGDFAEPLLPTS